MQYSVLMSIYHKEDPAYFQLSIESMLNQTVSPDEIVIVKDGPLTNELEQVIAENVKKHPAMFNIIQLEQNVGLGLSLNKGLKACRNDLVARMDTDDISLPVRCQRQLECFEKEPSLDIVGTMVDEFNDDPSRPHSSRIVPTEHEQIYQFAKRRSPFNHPTVMYKRSRVLECGGYSDLRRNQDVDLFGRMLFQGCKAANIDESLLLFRSNGELLKRRKNWDNTKSYVDTIHKFWVMGFSSFGDYLLVSIAQTVIFLCPVHVQNILYRRLLRKKSINDNVIVMTETKKYTIG